MSAEDTINTKNYGEDKDAKKTLVINTITENCASSAPKLSEPLKEGQKLEANILSGGITNYSYKIYIDKQPDICVFAKLSFEYALWNPNDHHDLQRTVNEYKMQQIMFQHTPDCVIAPLAIWDVDHNGQKAKLLMTEWSKADEQFGNQFADGSVDPRIAPKLADTLATLHNIKGFDPTFNEQVKPAMVGLLGFVKQTAEGVCDKTETKDRTEGYCQELGKEKLMQILQANINNLDTQDCLIHSDAHVFNILVEPKPDISKLEDFGPEGLMVLCDWETCIMGPIGKDVGGAIAAPIGCLVGHMLNGYRERSIDNYINTLLDDYTSKMLKQERLRKKWQSSFVTFWVGAVSFNMLFFTFLVSSWMHSV